MRMSDQTNLLSRIGQWFKRDPSSDEGNGDMLPHNGEGESVTAQRSSLLRPWAKRDQAISNLQGGLQAVADLMTTVRDNLERQSERQDQLLQYLSHLPEALKQLPESNKVQAETHKVIRDQLDRQIGQQQHLGEILNKISDTSGAHQEVLQQMNQRVDSLHEQDRSIADNLSSVGAAMQTVGQHSEASARIMEQLRDNQHARDDELQRLLMKQNTRFTSMLAIAIFLSIGALVAVAVIGYLLLMR
jgi:chromosome segregation ATPase